MNEFIETWVAYLAYPEQRLGQAAYNALHDVRPDLAKRLELRVNDPFYNDEFLPAFLKFLVEHWEES